MAGYKNKKNRKKWILLGCLGLIYIFISWGIPLFLQYYIPHCLDTDYNIQVSFSKISTKGWKKVSLSDTKISTNKFNLSSYLLKAEIPKLEIKYNLFGFLFSGKNFLDEILIDDVILETPSLINYRIDSKLTIKSDDKYEFFTIYSKGKYQGKIEISKVANLSFQIDLMNIQEAENSNVLKINGQLIDAEGGSVIISSEQLNNMINLEVKVNNLNLSEYVKRAERIISNQKLDLEFILKGDLDNLKRFNAKEKYYLAKKLDGYFQAKIFKKFEGEKIILQEIYGNYENNIADIRFLYTPGLNNKVTASIRVDEENFLNGKINGEITQVSTVFSEVLLENKVNDLSGGFSFIAKISGDCKHPEVDFKLTDQNLKYNNTAVNIRCEAVSNGLNIKVPIFQIESPDKILAASFESEVKLDKVISKIVKLEVGQKKNEFRNTGIIAIEFSKSGLTVNEFVLQSKNAELKSKLQVLPNGEGIGKVFIKNLNIKNLVEFFHLELPYKIDGFMTSEINFSCSITDPKVQVVGSLDNLYVNTILGGNCKFDIQMDKTGININSFNLINEGENSHFFMNGIIPINLDFRKGIFEEDIHHDRVLYFNCQNTSTTLLRKIIPKVDTLEGRITGEISSYKYEENRYFLGNLNLKGGKLAFASNLAPFTDVEGNFLFTKEKVEVPKVTGKMGEGTFEIKGSMKLLDLKVEAIDFLITGKKLKLINDDDLVVILSPNLTYKGSLDAPVLKGTLYADYGNYTENLSKLPDKIETFKSASNEYGFWPRTALDLEVRCDHKVNNSIKQSSFYLQGSANLKFKGFIANCYMSGLVRIEKGIIPVFSKEFIVEGGTVTFEENSQPYVNLVANYRANNIDVKMQVNQSLDDPIEPIYSSLPSYSEEELQRYLILNMLPGQEGESFDFFRFIKTSIDYSDILSNDTLKWLKRFSFETRTRNKSGQEELGLTVEYKFDDPEWFSVKAIQDDNGVFNFFLVASKDFFGHYVDPSIFTNESFSHLEPKLIADFTTELLSIEGMNYPARGSQEFDIQYLVKLLNHCINIKDFNKYLTDDIITLTKEKLNEYVRVNEKIMVANSSKDTIKAMRKFNRGVIEIVFAKYFKKSKNVDEKEDKNIFNNELENNDLKRQQKISLQNLIKDELKSYVNTNDSLYLNHASKKMARVCASWGYKDAKVEWEKLEKVFLNSQKTVNAVKFKIETGIRFKFKALNFPGIPPEEVSELIKFIKFQPHKNSAPVYYSENYVDFLINQTHEFYLQRGYLDVRVFASEEKIVDSKSKEITANIIVNKKQLYRLGNFELYGNEKFTKAEIMEVVIKELKKKNIIENENLEEGYFHGVLLAKLKKHISEYYRQRGFYYVEVSNRVKSVYEYQNVDEFSNNFDFAVFIKDLEKTKGAKPLKELFPEIAEMKNAKEYYYFFNQMICSSTMRWLFLQNYIKVENWKDPKIIELYLEVKKNRDDQQEQVLIRKLLKELFNFIELDVNSKDLDTVSGEIIRQSIVCQIKENNLYKFGKITFKPRNNDDFKTQSKVIKKKISIKEGDLYNIEKIRGSVRALSRLGVFQEVDFQETVNNDLVDVEFILRENKTLAFQIEGGYGEFERFQAGLRIFDHNIFGSTKSLGLRGMISTKSLLIEPVFDTPAFCGFRNEWIGFYEYSDKQDFTLERFGFETNLHRTILKNFGLSFGYKFENTTAKDLVDELDQLDVGYVNYSGIQGKFSYIDIDDLLIPHKGTFFKVKAEYNSKIFGSTFDFLKTEVQATEHLPISERVTFSIGARFGFMKSLDSRFDIPIQTKFFNGGGNTVRGYEHNSIGPEIDGKSTGGEVRGIFNTELRFPLTLRTVKQFGVVFFDSGFLENSIETLDDPEIYSSIGIGYRYLSPIGPIRLDLGLGLKNRREDESGVNLEHEGAEIRNLYIDGYKARLHLSFGFAF